MLFSRPHFLTSVAHSSRAHRSLALRAPPGCVPQRVSLSHVPTFPPSHPCLVPVTNMAKTPIRNFDHLERRSRVPGIPGPSEILDYLDNLAPTAGRGARAGSRPDNPARSMMAAGTGIRNPGELPKNP
jgi:hypothetical protein